MMPFSADSPILSTVIQGTAEQCSRFMMARAHGEYNAMDIGGAIVPAYFSVCASVGMDPVMLLAQMIHETGCLTSWWSQRPRRNPAGIGVTGRTSPTQPASGAWALRENVWAEGVSFPSWKDDSIPAHAGRLLAYTLRDDQANDTQRAMIQRALRYRPLPAHFRGVAPSWRGLNGRWAVPGTTYADKIAEIANAMLRS
jgi:Mannosyl-glycoprotein endo-beta-N-acetylglucosaminidase